MASGQPPQLDFDKLWADKYQEVFANLARKKKNLNEFGDPDYLFSDLYWNVWRAKAVPGWPQYYRKAVDPEFNRWVMMLLHNYIIDQARKMKTTPQVMRQQAVPLSDSPFSGAESEGNDVTNEQLIGAVENGFRKVEDAADWKILMDKVQDSELKAALGVLWSDFVRYHESISQLFKRMELATGVSRTTIIRKLRSEPAVLEYLSR